MHIAVDRACPGAEKFPLPLLHKGGTRQQVCEFVRSVVVLDFIKLIRCLTSSKTTDLRLILKASTATVKSAHLCLQNVSLKVESFLRNIIDYLFFLNIF